MQKFSCLSPACESNVYVGKMMVCVLTCAVPQLAGKGREVWMRGSRGGGGVVPLPLLRRYLVSSPKASGFLVRRPAALPIPLLVPAVAGRSLSSLFAVISTPA